MEQKPRDFYEEIESSMGIFKIIGFKPVSEINPMKHLKEFDKIRESLIIRPLNYKLNKDRLKDVVYRREGSIALTAYIAIGEHAGIFTSRKVSLSMAEEWKKSNEEVLEAAMRNTLRLYPPRICSWRHLDRLSIKSDFGDFMNPKKPFWLNSGPGGNLLTTVNKLNGAAAVFLPGVAARLGDLMEDDYLVAFTSMHEAMIHNRHTTSVKSIREVLKNMNKKIVSEEDFLTDDIYRYDRSLGKLHMIT